MDLKRNNFFTLIFLCILCFSCDEKRVFDEYQSLNGKWKQEDVVRFTFEQNDTINPYNLFLNIRNNNDYPFSNLFVTVSLKQPDSLVKIDTLEYAMANPDGSLMGEGFSDVKESKLWYQENFVFKQKGTYTIEIQQALRETGSVIGVEELNGVTDVGFRIEKTK
ncbi:MAG: gliding motility lipoprotein GldH [Flavobacterium sp.]|uniref:gliding motility lipoprotein GldH n=1 Tax=Flavobacterium sp. TaxID=239 RepID=UPI000C405550|nr:gliding motility lipoprotein GldH [Flavobacterium sp.]MBF03385.1 gliding motility lipoprotein GldH [Flavobacterium sp.]|tara:strand:+ start:635 stop:1126 length:492 start_codon:yes stop_codon:yes gene_type:complete